tara:strand:+ start:937 stop:1704 length:768 start_codon:yes stop_codon:yes gene_type:complete
MAPIVPILAGIGGAVGGTALGTGLGIASPLLAGLATAGLGAAGGAGGSALGSVITGKKPSPLGVGLGALGGAATGGLASIFGGGAQAAGGGAQAAAAPGIQVGQAATATGPSLGLPGTLGVSPELSALAATPGAVTQGGIPGAIPELARVPLGTSAGLSQVPTAAGPSLGAEGATDLAALFKSLKPSTAATLGAAGVKGGLTALGGILARPSQPRGVSFEGAEQELVGLSGGIVDAARRRRKARSARLKQRRGRK